jgi:transposase
MTTIGASEASSHTVYAAIELSKKTWVLGITTPERDQPSIHRIAGGNLRALVARVRAAAKSGRRI